jgi:hypothetical protein
VTYAQLEVSAQAGLIAGDPSRIYFIRQIPQGDLGIAVESWRVFLELWHVAVEKLDSLAKVGEAVAGGAIAVKVVQRALRTLKSRVPRWAQRGATPGNLDQAFGGADNDRELAERLQCSPDEAAAYSAFFSAINGGDDLLTAIHRELARAESYSRGGSIDYRELFSIRIEELIREGREAPPTPLDQLQIDMESWMRETFELPDDTAPGAEDIFGQNSYEDKASRIEGDVDDYLTFVRLLALWMIVLPALVVGVALDARCYIRVLSATLTVIAVAVVVVSSSVRRRIQRVLARVIPFDEWL